MRPKPVIHHTILLPFQPLHPKMLPFPSSRLVPPSPEPNIDAKSNRPFAAQTPETIMESKLSNRASERVLKTEVDKVIEREVVVVYSSSDCDYCDAAKKLLWELDVRFHSVEIDEMEDKGKKTREDLYAKTGRKTVPNIFINGRCIGGFSDGPGLVNLHKRRLLLPWVRKLRVLGASKEVMKAPDG
ncbi:hypothetical protein AAMO2058_001639900 [Amorphochlora amoebiformis]